MSEKTWLEVLQRPPESPKASIAFDKLGVSADIAPLSEEEMEECVAMGGVRGQKYALYLACEDIREAGRELCDRGEMIIPFDAMDRLPAEDIKAAYDVICTVSRPRENAEAVEAVAPLQGEAEDIHEEAAVGQEREAAGRLSPLVAPVMEHVVEHRAPAMLSAQGEAPPWDFRQDLSARRESAVPPQEIDIEYIAGELCRRLIDAAASM